MWENDNTVSYDLQSDGSFWIYGIHHYSLCIFKDGNWAEFIDTITPSTKVNNTVDTTFGNVMSQLDDISRDLKKIKKQLNKTNKSKQWQ